MGLGPIMLDIHGLELDGVERELLAHPAVGGVILFSRNYQSPTQLTALCDSIHQLREPRLIIAVDHEGGRVQRFREGFTVLPPAASFGATFDHDPDSARGLALDAGWLMAAELRACGVDVSFAPVLDLDRKRSQVIGDRAFHARADVVTQLARAFARGMRDAGMAAIGKHFPGHGAVEEDSHVALPVDSRDLASIQLDDLVPFERLANDGLAGIMTAHLLVPAVDAYPVSFSRRWVSGILRGQLGFSGAVFSDDLSMGGARGEGAPGARAALALAAGCDVVLVCNEREAAVEIVESVVAAPDAVRFARLARLHGRGALNFDELQATSRRAHVLSALNALDPTPELNLGDDNPA